MLPQDFNIFLCDFGIAKKVSDADMTNLTTNVGTAAYMAPEMIQANVEGVEEEEGEANGDGAEGGGGVDGGGVDGGDETVSEWSGSRVAEWQSEGQSGRVERGGGDCALVAANRAGVGSGVDG